MPIHDWSRVDAGIFHDFHHAWIEQIKRLLNSGVLPPDHYAMAEQHTSHFGPAVLTRLPEMPLFLKAGGHVPVALESTYESAWEAVPRRWRSVIEE